MSRFVAAGGANDTSLVDDEWSKAEQWVKDTKQQKSETGRQDGGKTLYEVLQANKAAKQEAYEESVKLKNQFRNLDEDEVDFLDSVLESTRAKDASVKKETSEQLEAFRKQQDDANKQARVAEDGMGATADDEQWAVMRKRKRQVKNDALHGVKVRRKSSSQMAGPGIQEASGTSTSTVQVHSPESISRSEPSITTPGSPRKLEAKASASPSMAGLVPYDSDDD